MNGIEFVLEDLPPEREGLVQQACAMQQRPLVGALLPGLVDHGDVAVGPCYDLIETLLDLARPDLEDALNDCFVMHHVRQARSDPLIVQGF